MGGRPTMPRAVKIFCIYNYTSLFHTICQKGLYMPKRLCEVIVVKVTTTKFNFFLVTFLWFFQKSRIIYGPLQAVLCIFSSYWWREAYTTHIGPSDESLFLHKPSSVTSPPHSPPLFHQEGATEKYRLSNFSGSIYWNLYVLLVHFIASWSSEMHFGVMYLETWGGTQTYVAFSTLEFCSLFFVFGRTCMVPNSLNIA